MSVCRAAGTPTARETASAVSTSDATMKSTSSWPSRHTSRYSGFVVRTIVVVRDDSAFVIIAETMFDSSRDVHAMSRSAFVTPAAERTRRLAPFPSTVATSYRFTSAARRDSSRSKTVRWCSSLSAWTIVVADLAGADDEDVHAAQGYSASRVTTAALRLS